MPEIIEITSLSALPRGKHYMFNSEKMALQIATDKVYKWTRKHGSPLYYVPAKKEEEE